MPQRRRQPSDNDSDPPTFEEHPGENEQLVNARRTRIKTPKPDPQRSPDETPDAQPQVPDRRR